MTTKHRQTAAKKQAKPVETSQSIEQQTAAFLQAGGEIQIIKSGVSGQQNLRGSRHIRLGNAGGQNQNTK